MSRSEILEGLRRVDRTPCSRCGHVGALHVSSGCYAFTSEGRCSCGYPVRTEREIRLPERIALLAVGISILITLGYFIALDLAR